MKIGVLTEGAPSRAAETTRLAERTGFDLCGFSDTHLLVPELHTTLGVVGNETDEIEIGPVVTNPVTRHPSVTASAIATLHQHTGGRAFLGLATGDSAVHTLGKEPASLRELRKAAQLCKGLWRGESVEYEGKSLRLHWVPEEGLEIPLAMSAEGPKTLELAGYVADRTVVGLGATPTVLDAAAAAIERGAEKAGRSADDVETWLYMPANLGADYESAVDELTPRLAGIVAHSMNHTLEGKAVPEEYEDAVRHIVEHYDFREHIDQAGANRELVERVDGLKEYLGRRYAVAGPPDRCVERLREIADTGHVDGVMVYFEWDTREQIERFGSEVLLRL